MKTRILTITLIVIGAFIACKKVEQKLSNPTYTDAELKIDKNSAFAFEERKIKEGIMGFSALSKTDRKKIVDGIIMDNKNVANVVGNVMPIINKMNNKDIIPFFKILIPNKSFILIDGDKTIAEYKVLTPDCDYWIGYWNKRYLTYTIDNCKAPGFELCMKYVACP
jgi:hypothetical protein